METVSLVYEKFNDITASKIIQFMQHPTAEMLKDYFEYKDVLKFDTRTNWEQWQTLYGLTHIGNHNRHYLTYGGGPEGGIVKSYGDGWYVWHRNWNERIQYTRIPDALEIVYRGYDDGHEAIKMVMSKHNYELGEDEHFLDDLENDLLDWQHRINDTDNESEEEVREWDENEEDMDSD